MYCVQRSKIPPPKKKVSPVGVGATRKVRGWISGGRVQVGAWVIGTLVRFHCTTHCFGHLTKMGCLLVKGPFRSIG